MKKTFPMRLLSVLLCVAILATVTPLFAAAESAIYLAYNSSTGLVDAERQVTDVNVIDEATDSFVTGWNIVKDDVTFGDRIVLPEDVNLILADGATLTAQKGITVAADGDFAIYAQSNDANAMGKLVVPDDLDFFDAGISGAYAQRCGNISIYGGNVTVQGGENAVAIGAANFGQCGNISIYGGIVTARGGAFSSAIGSSKKGVCGDITISDGKVNAQGGLDGTGIGSGEGNSACGNITISGGTVTAQGGENGAGIGSGVKSSCGDITIFDGTVTAQGGENGAGIGSGSSGSCGYITILGGTVTAQGGENGAGIGSGNCIDPGTGVASSCGAVTITSGIVFAQGGRLAPGIGCYTPSDVEMASCGKMTITGGYIKATAGKGTTVFIGVAGNPKAGEVSIDRSCISVIYNNSQYINYIIPTVWPSCTESGVLEHYIDPVSDLYYSSLSFEKNTRIGDDAALAKWKVQGGGGYMAPLGHHWQYVDDDTHKCTRCDATEAHTGVSEDYTCDDCGYVWLDVAKADAIAALNDAAGETPSAAVQASLDAACEQIEDADSVESVLALKEMATSMITAQMAAEAKVAAQTLADAKDAAETALEAAIGDKPSDELLTVYAEALHDVHTAATITAVQEAEEAGFAAIAAQLATEADAAKQAVEDELAQAEKDLAAANDTIAELNNTVKSKDATIAEKQAALDTATEQLNAAKTDLDKAKADLETAKANIEELEGTVSEKDEALAQAAKDLEDAQQTLAQNEQEIKDLQAEIERLKALLDDDPTDPQPTEMLGDANNDGAVNMKDVLLMRKYLAGLDVEYNAENADCNGDGEVNMKDVLMLRKYLANIIDTLGA